MLNAWFVADPVAIRQDIELAHPALRAGQLPRERGLIGEGRHHVELFCSERISTVAPYRDQDANDESEHPSHQTSAQLLEMLEKGHFPVARRVSVLIRAGCWCLPCTCSARRAVAAWPATRSGCGFGAAAARSADYSEQSGFDAE